MVEHTDSLGGSWAAGIELGGWPQSSQAERGASSE